MWNYDKENQKAIRFTTRENIIAPGLGVHLTKTIQSASKVIDTLKEQMWAFSMDSCSPSFFDCMPVMDSLLRQFREVE